MGESSSAAALPQGPGVDLADPVTGQKGPALFSIAALITLMLSRCTTARCAIQTAGDLAEQHGFYGEGWGSGEALTVRAEGGGSGSARQGPGLGPWLARRVEVSGLFSLRGRVLFEGEFSLLFCCECTIRVVWSTCEALDAKRNSLAGLF